MTLMVSPVFSQTTALRSRSEIDISTEEGFNAFFYNPRALIKNIHRKLLSWERFYSSILFFLQTINGHVLPATVLTLAFTDGNEDK
jgi:hypothetical protein